MNEMRQATRRRIGRWIEENRLYVFLFSGMAFIFGLLMGENNPLGVPIMVMSLGVFFVFILPIETMIGGIG